MQVDVRGGGGCQQPLQHTQLHAVVGDVVAAAQQLHGLRLRACRKMYTADGSANDTDDIKH